MVLPQHSSCVETRLIPSSLGFPRKLDQAEYLERNVGPVHFVIIFDCPQSVLVQRLSQRGRADDDADNVKRRIETFKATTSQVLQKYGNVGKVVETRTNTEMEDVCTRLQQLLKEHDVALETRSGDISGKN
jgi:UMP-CMP kinase